MNAYSPAAMDFWPQISRSCQLRQNRHEMRSATMHVLMNATFKRCARSLIGNFTITDEEGYTLGSNRSISISRFKKDSLEYKKLRERLLNILKAAGMTPEEYARGRPTVEVAFSSDDDDDDDDDDEDERSEEAATIKAA